MVYNLPLPALLLVPVILRAGRKCCRRVRTENVPCTDSDIAASASPLDSQDLVTAESRVPRGVTRQKIASPPVWHHLDIPASARSFVRSWRNASEAPTQQTYVYQAALFGLASLYRCRRKGNRLEILKTLKYLRSAETHLGIYPPQDSYSILASNCRIFCACSCIDNRTRGKYWQQ